MASNYNDGFYNSAYHDSQTLEIDRQLQSRPSSRPPTQNSSFCQNPYEEDDNGNHEHSFPRERNWRGSQRFLPMNAEQMDMDYTMQIPRHSSSRKETYALGHYNPSFWDENGPSYIDFDEDTDYPNDVSSEGLRTRGRKGSVFPSQYVRQTNIASLDPALEREIENSIKNEKEKLIAELAELSNSDIANKIQKLPICLNEKRNMRNQVLLSKMKSLNGGFQMDHYTGSIKLPFRRFKEAASDFFKKLQLWHSTLKVIEGNFGSSILSYFIFLKWLLLLNLFSFLVNFSFITIPMFVDMPPNNLSFSGLELLTGAGYFEKTVLYYGFYTNETIRKEASLEPYNMQLAYIFTIGLYLATCFLILLFSIAKSFRKNFINPASKTGNSAKLLCSWDFSINSEKAVKLKKKHLSTLIKETLSKKLLQKLKLSVGQKLGRFCVHMVAWMASVALAVGCCAGVYFLCVHVGESTQDSNLNELIKQAETLLVPVVVSLINLIMPLVYSVFGLVEKFKYPHHEIYVVIIRNILLKISIVGILCYYWLQKVAESNFECWESYVGQDIYRLVVIDFLFVLFGSFFGEFLRRILGVYCCKKLGMPEFDIARNVLDLIYAQTLAWIGIFFSPLLPLIQIIKLFFIFYLKRVSLVMNCTPPRRAWRASQMTTVFILLLLFPSFAGVLCVIGVTIWRRVPSKMCGPFRHLLAPYESVEIWVGRIDLFNTKWVVWIYRNLLQSVLFFYILTAIVLIFSYLQWQIVQGRKIMVKQLFKQIADKGKDKFFLIKELRKAQKPDTEDHGGPQQKLKTQPAPAAQAPNKKAANVFKSQIPQHTGASNAPALPRRPRQQGNSPPKKRKTLSHSSSIVEIQMARQPAEHDMDQPSYIAESLSGVNRVIRANQQAVYKEPQYNQGPSNVIEMIMRARQQAEYEEQQPPFGTDA